MTPTQSLTWDTYFVDKNYFIPMRGKTIPFIEEMLIKVYYALGTILNTRATTMNKKHILS